MSEIRKIYVEIHGSYILGLLQEYFKKEIDLNFCKIEFWFDFHFWATVKQFRFKNQIQDVQFRIGDFFISRQDKMLLLDRLDIQN